MLKYKVLSFDELFVDGKGFEIFFHIFNFNFATKLLQNLPEILQINVFGKFLEDLNMSLKLNQRSEMVSESFVEVIIFVNNV